MSAESAQLRARTSYNLAGMSFSPAELSDQISHHVPAFKVRYHPDFRQAIADSWPQSIDDVAARPDWGWRAVFGLADMVADMLAHIPLEWPTTGAQATAA